MKRLKDLDLAELERRIRDAVGELLNTGDSNLYDVEITQVRYNRKQPPTADIRVRLRGNRALALAEVAESRVLKGERTEEDETERDAAF